MTGMQKYKVRGDRSAIKTMLVTFTVLLVFLSILALITDPSMSGVVVVSQMIVLVLYFGASEIAFGNTNYVILKAGWLDARNDTWGLDKSTTKQTLPYEGILTAVALDSGIRITYHARMSGGKYSGLKFNLDVPVENPNVVATEIQRRADAAAPSRVMWRDTAPTDRTASVEG